MDDISLLDPFERLLEDLSNPAQVRATEAGTGITELWAGLTDSGFLDAMVPEALGGVGLALRDVGRLVEALGSHATPAPVAETMVARALLTGAGLDTPSGPVVLATAHDGRAPRVSMGCVADHALVDDGMALQLVSLNADSRQPLGVHGSLAADIKIIAPEAQIARPLHGLRPVCAVIHSARIAGAASRLLDMTIAYANERGQFGKPVGKLQAIQQQLSLMAEKMVLVRMAARIGYACDLLPDPAAAATAKSVASAAAPDIAAIAHAVHGAIGVSEEHDLQLYTRRLHEWRAADGSEGYWTQILGEARLASEADATVDFVRSLYAIA
ncbi:acyl-CoA dehydrogenase family protein [Sphingomonas oryzagri]